MASDILDAVYGCLVGGAIGDAMGAPVEGWYHKAIKAKYGKLDRLLSSYRGNTGDSPGDMRDTPSTPGEITDDSTMRHYLALSIARKGGRITPEDYASVLLERMNPGRVWRSDRIILEKLRLGMNPWETGKNNMPNGSATMAIAPIGIINAGDPEQAYKDGFIIASMTQEGVDRDAAAITAATVAAALAPSASVENVLDVAVGSGTSLISRAISLALELARRSSSIDEFAERFYDRMLYWHAPQPPHKGPWDREDFFSGSSLEIVPAALAIFYLCDGEVNRCIVEGVCFGRDNDTIASVVANIAGALQGASAIRSEWIDAVETANLSFFEELSEDENLNFYNMSCLLVNALANERARSQSRLNMLDALLGS